jgi:hypothetical protein
VENNTKSDQEIKTEVLDKIADFVVKRDLAVVAILFLESTRPLHYIGAQALLFFEPFLTLLGDPNKVRLFRESMESKEDVEYLVKKMEELNDK